MWMFDSIRMWARSSWRRVRALALRSWRAPFAALILLCLLVWLLDCRVATTAPSPVGVPRIVVRLSAHEVAVGETLRMQVVGELGDRVRLCSVSHKISRIGFFHRRLGKLVYFDANCHFWSTTGEEVVSGLPLYETGSGFFILDTFADGEKGLEYKLRTERVGAYLIAANWSMQEPGKKGRIEAYSEPSILIVRPRTWPGAPDPSTIPTVSAETEVQQKDMEVLFDLLNKF